MVDDRLSGKKRSEDDKNRNPNGTFREGNVIGRFPKKLTLNYLTKLIRKDEKSNPDKKTILKHYKDRLFKNDNLLAKFMDKYIPTKTISELTGAGGEPIRYVIEKTYEKPGEQEKPEVEEKEELKELESGESTGL